MAAVYELQRNARNMTHRENTLRAYRFGHPEWIPVTSGFPAPCWEFHGPDALEELLTTHPIMFPGYSRGSIYPDNLPIGPHTLKDEPYTDPWGSVWRTMMDGMVGAVAEHPLESWDSFDGFVAPDPEETDGMLPIDWEGLKKAGGNRSDHYPFAVALTHGHTFLRLQDLRGYTNLIYDMADDEPRLWSLIKMVEVFNISLVNRFLQLDPDVIMIPEDLGSQTGPLLSPDLFRKFVKPSYLRITEPIKAAGILVHQHSDGAILDLFDDLMAAGGDILNLQDLVNGLDNIERVVKGRVAIDLDIDRQNITVNGTPADVRDHIQEAVRKLGSPEGGLSLCYQPWPPTPIENIRAVFDAMEEFSSFYTWGSGDG